MIKYIPVLFALLVALLPFGHKCGLMAQGSHLSSSGAQKVIAARNLSISRNKTCMLIFPAAIQSADRGAAYVLAERVKGSENVLKVKAGRPDFEPSSLTVITTDGQVFSFLVSYAAHPPYLVLDFRDEWSGRSTVHFKGTTLNSAQIKRSAGRVKVNAPFIKNVDFDKYDLDFKMDGIYIDKDVLFFRFRLHNGSSIPYKLASLRFFVRDLKTAKRTAVQDNELKPLYMHTWDTPEDDIGQVIVVAMHRFTITDKKNVAIELMEKDGDRGATLRLKQRKLRKTRKLYHP